MLLRFFQTTELQTQKDCEEATENLLRGVIPAFALKTLLKLNVDDPEFNSKLVNAAHRLISLKTLFKSWS